MPSIEYVEEVTDSYDTSGQILAEYRNRLQEMASVCSYFPLYRALVTTTDPNITTIAKFGDYMLEPGSATYLGNSSLDSKPITSVSEIFILSGNFTGPKFDFVNSTFIDEIAPQLAKFRDLLIQADPANKQYTQVYFDDCLNWESEEIWNVVVDEEDGKKKWRKEGEYKPPPILYLRLGGPPVKVGTVTIRCDENGETITDTMLMAEQTKLYALDLSNGTVYQHTGLSSFLPEDHYAWSEVGQIVLDQKTPGKLPTEVPQLTPQSIPA